ncbi:HAD domain-containing protein [Nocardia nova]|uniref:HAD domain-containing protein n=1 Tax=Nocardia nova TaxID=37330 RepID=UPI003409C51E
MLDVDGVLAPTSGREGFRAHTYNGPGLDGSRVTGAVLLNEAHGAWLNGLLVTGVEVAWATSWLDLANEWIAPRIGLRQSLPVIDVGRSSGVRFGWTSKFKPVSEFAAGRHLAWVDDDFGGKEPGWAEDRTRFGLTTLIVQPYPLAGLTAEHMSAVDDWAEAVLSVDTTGPIC